MFIQIQSSLGRGAMLAMVLLSAACGKSEDSAYQPGLSQKIPLVVQEYQFAAVPEGSQMRVSEVYAPLVDYLNTHIEGARLVSIAPKNHAELDDGLRHRAYQIALVNALQTIHANEFGYHVIAKKGDDSQFYGIFLVRRDSGIRNVSDLGGKKVCYPSPAGVAATILPKQFLRSHGIDVFRDIENLYAGSHESSIMHVYLGKAAAGTARDFSWNDFQKMHSKEAAELEVKWQTEPLIDQAIIVRDDVPVELTDRIGKLLISLHETAEGRALLSKMSASRFEPANDATYDKARKFFAENSDLLNSGASSTKAAHQTGERHD